MTDLHWTEEIYSPSDASLLANNDSEGIQLMQKGQQTAVLN